MVISMEKRIGIIHQNDVRKDFATLDALSVELLV